MSKEAIGSVGEEAAKLFAVLQQASADARHGTGAESNGYDAFAEAFPEEAEEQGACECQWCPVCQLISRAKQVSPETIEHLATAAAGVLGSVRSLLEAAAEAARQARTDADAAAGPEHDETVHDEEGTRPKADRIDVSEDPEPWD
ncbi:hypothetical protein OG394_11255 [Kribbella sp. NBC_01245]|uniref:hypothetical protein n=1 Tax=Kribbella sp. NBC_01245 TaxID=2903578 RepID=UPI002E2E51D6|nr:hypothetical protein [Kribbella sp. NBC_01245]